MSVIGLRVGPFEIEEAASVPEPGDWYRARRAGMTRRQPLEVLVRLLPPDASGDERAALQREFETLRSLDDARIPSPVAFYEGTGALALSAPEGAPLTALVSERAVGSVALTPSTLLDLGLEVAEALQHAHTKGKVHGHLSPEVVALGAEARLVVWGFGPGPQAAPLPEWIAPERARSQPITPATDQWALAALLAGLVTGKAPWRGADPSVEARKGDPGPIVAAVEAQWPAFGRLLRRMMDPHPANRFPSLHPVRQELLALARKAGGTSDRRELGAQLMARVPPRAPAEAAVAVVAEVTPEPVVAPEPVVTPGPPIVATVARPPAAAATAAVSVAVEAPRVTPAPPPPRPKRDPLVQEPLPVVRVAWQDDDEPASVETEVVQRADLEPSGPTVMMRLGDLPNLARQAPPDADPTSEVPLDEPLEPDESDEEEPLLEPSEATMLVSPAEIARSLAALRAQPEPPAIPAPPPAPLSLPTQADAEVSEVTGSNEATTLFSSAMLDRELASLGDLEAELASEEVEVERPTAVPLSDPGLTTADPRPAAAPVARRRTIEPVRDPYTGDTSPGLDLAEPMTAQRIEALAAQISPAAEGAEEPPGSPAPGIERVAPWVAVAMVVGMVVLLAWNWM